MIALFCLCLTLLVSPFKSKGRLEAENAALRHQLIILRRKVRGRVRLTDGDRLFFIQLYRWFPTILKAITIVRPETLVRWHRACNLGIELVAVEVRRVEDIVPALIAIRGQVQALYVPGDALIFTHRVRVLTVALTGRLPTIHNFREHVDAGGLMSYGPSFVALYRRSADYVDKILRGTKPSDIPVEQPTKFDLIINLVTAKALGLTVPPSLLARADEVIEGAADVSSSRCSAGGSAARRSDARYTGHVCHRAARSARPERAHAVGRREGVLNTPVASSGRRNCPLSRPRDLHRWRTAGLD